MNKNIIQCKFIKSRNQFEHHVLASKKDPTRMLCAYHYDYVKRYWSKEQRNAFDSINNERPLIGRPKKSLNKPKVYEIYNYEPKNLIKLRH
jgi:hypothetical protein